MKDDGKVSPAKDLAINKEKGEHHFARKVISDLYEETSNILLECDASQDVFKSSSVQAYNFPEDVEEATVAETDECFAAHPQEE
ncbi:hypothetical protein V6N13_115543 [Hibiscus sabdariffa]